MIAVEQVGVDYRGVPAVRGVTLTVHTGEWCALIGPNGAGKTSLLRAVARLVRHHGVVRIDGRPTGGLRRRRLAQLVAYVPQQPELPADMTVDEYVLLGRNPHIGYFGWESRADRRVCAELVDRLSLRELADRRLATLSGGERQRLVLARALAQQAPVLLLDEPTSALDLGRRVDAMELVDELRRERGLTVLSAVHDLTLAGQFADRLHLLDAGRLVATGRPDEVLREDLLADRFGVGVSVLHTPDGLPVVVSRRAGGPRATVSR